MVIGEEDLATVGERRDPCAPMNVDSDVSLRRDGRLAGVQPHPDADRAGVEPVAAGEGGRDGLCGGREGDEERVALGVDLDAAVCGEDRPQDPSVLGQRFRVAVGAESVQEPRRPLDVGEAGT